MSGGKDEGTICQWFSGQTSKAVNLIGLAGPPGLSGHPIAVHLADPEWYTVWSFNPTLAPPK